MPFFLVEYENQNNGNELLTIDPAQVSQNLAGPDGPDNAPIFLLPGIFGNGFELVGLAKQLRRQSEGRRPIFIYVEERLIKKDSDASDRSGALAELCSNNRLDAECKSIADKMIVEMIPYLSYSGFNPYIIVGYSYGCVQAVLASQHLKKKGFESSVFLLDAPSPECSQKYFKDGSQNAIHDLIAIVKCAAELVGLKIPPNINISSKEIPIIPSLYDCLDNIANKILGELYNVNPLQKENFIKLVELAKIKLSNLLNYQSSLNFPPLNNMNVLITPKTAEKFNSIYITANKPEKYKDNKLGWDKYAAESTSLYIINNEDFKDLDHSDIVTEQNSKKLAEEILKQINNQLTRANLMSLRVKQVLEQLRVYMKQQGNFEEGEAAIKELSDAMSQLSTNPSQPRPSNFGSSKNSHKISSDKNTEVIPPPLKDYESGNENNLQEKNRVNFSSKNTSFTSCGEDSTEDKREVNGKSSPVSERRDLYGRFFAPNIVVNPLSIDSSSQPENIKSESTINHTLN